MQLRQLLVLAVLCLAETSAMIRQVAGEVPRELERWLGPQVWQRDVDVPVLSLGESGDFDDAHIFAPTVARDDGQFLLWYCGSQGFAHDLAKERKPDERVFKMGLAISKDGKLFERHQKNPVFALDDPRRSVLTPTVLRNADGSVLREAGRIRMWFSSGTLGGGGRVHSIQETTSVDGVNWSAASPVQIERAYAPTVIKTDAGYEMWYTVPVLLTIVATLASPAYGWSDAGHRIVASIAFRQLSGEECGKVIEILKGHPRYEAEFNDKAPVGLDRDQINEWMYQQAALWPDLVRDYRGDLARQFHRPNWHYINLPHFLSDADRAAMEGKLMLNVSLQAPAEDQQEMNVVQAIRYARALLVDDNGAASDKALMLSLLFHNVGDLHQPLLSVSLFSRNLFPNGVGPGKGVIGPQPVGVVPHIGVEWGC